MKKRYAVISILAICAAALSIWLLIRPKALGNINHACSEPETRVSKVSFSGMAGERIKLSFTSNIEKGNLSIRICDSKGNVMKALDRAKKLETFLDLDHSDTYTLESDYKDFVGSFKIAVYKLD